MKPIKFPGYNIIMAENQKQYLPLPVHRSKVDPNDIVTSCWEMSIKERIICLFTGKVYCQQWCFGNFLQAQRLCVDKPPLGGL
jgi:hypothetical protein